MRQPYLDLLTYHKPYIINLDHYSNDEIDHMHVDNCSSDNDENDDFNKHLTLSVVRGLDIEDT